MSEHYIAASKDKGVSSGNVSSSGGIVTELARLFFQDNGVVYGATFDAQQYRVVHVGIESEEELYKIRKSKYVQSDMKGCMEDMEKKLRLGRKVLFTGTPCQAAAVTNKFPEYKNLLVVDLFCHGVAQPKYFTEYLNLFLEHVTGVDFRGQSDYGNYEFCVCSNEREIVKQEWFDNLFTCLYTNSLVMHPACFDCKYVEKGTHRGSMTLGDFSYDVDNHIMDAPHPSIVAVNDERGRTVFDSIKSKLDFYKLEDEEKINSYYLDREKQRGQWGYNLAEKEVFDERSKKYGFKRAAYMTLYPKECAMIEKAYKSCKKISIYGCGVTGKAIYEIAVNLYPDMMINGFLVTSKEKNMHKIKDVGVKEITEKEMDSSEVIIVGVADQYNDEVKAELKKRGITNYIDRDMVL